MISTLQRDTFKTSRPEARNIKLFTQEARRTLPVCELNEELDVVLTRLGEQHPEKMIAPISDGQLYVNVPPEILERVLSLLLEGMIGTGLWNDGEEGCISPVICKCLHGYGAVLELTDELSSLPAKFMVHFAQQKSAESPDMAGRQFLKARDLIERHGGRLHITSPLFEHGTGTAIQLFLPLAPRSAQSARVDTRKEVLMEATA